MQDNTRRMIRAYRSLTEQERKEFLDSLKNMELGGKLNESVIKELGVRMGPLGGTCPYCGK